MQAALRALQQQAVGDHARQIRLAWIGDADYGCPSNTYPIFFVDDGFDLGQYGYYPPSPTNRSSEALTTAKVWSSMEGVKYEPEQCVVVLWQNSRWWIISAPLYRACGSGSDESGSEESGSDESGGSEESGDSGSSGDSGASGDSGSESGSGSPCVSAFQGPIDALPGYEEGVAQYIRKTAAGCLEWVTPRACN